MLSQKLYTARLCLLASALVLASCSSKPVDVRTVLPGDALVYLEAADLGRTLRAVAESSVFTESAKTAPELSYVDGIQIAVAVTGFETSEEKITEENSVLNMQPRFVAAAETRLWNFQALKFTEERLGLFINDVYGGEVLLESSEKHGGKYYVWTADDGRKAYALVIDSLILFGNDESAIEKCLAVRRGEADSIARNQKIAGADGLAFGYVSPDGVAQLSNLAGISLAKQAGEEAEVQSFIARVLPELLRNSLTEITWTATRVEDGIEDRFDIVSPAEPANVFAATLTPAGGSIDSLVPFMKTAPGSVTRYNLSDPRVAWRSVLLTAQKQTDELSGSLIVAFADSLFEPYGIDNAELFLSSIGSQIITARYSGDDTRQVVIAEARDIDALKRSIAAELSVARPPERVTDADVWRSPDGDLVMILVDGKVILGDPSAALGCLEQYRQAGGPAPALQRLAASDAPAATYGSDADIAANVVDVMSERKDPNARHVQHYLTETRFSRRGIERRTVSDLGLIGTLIAQFDPE